MGADLPFDRGKAATQLREAAKLPLDISLAGIAAVLEHTGDDFDLALTSLTMIPRPPWVNEKLGLHPERKS